jgi:hypothetical protein
MGTLVRALACSAVVPFLFAGGALAQNFHALSQQEHCESVMEQERLYPKCKALNKEKDEVCKPGVCDIDAHAKQIEKYKADVARLAAGGIEDAERGLLEASIAQTKAELDQRKSDAATQSQATNKCVVARQNVYDFFENQVIPATLKAAAEANTLHDQLRKELDNAKALQASAKDRREDLAGADPETDRARYDEYVRAEAEYETNTAAYREAENNLGQFNSFHGDDIDYYVNRLITYYREEQADHKIQIDQQKNIYETCEKVAGMSY